jgi:hypothetical protein
MTGQNGSVWRESGPSSTAKVKTGKAIPLQAWTEPEGSRRSRGSQISRKSAHEDGKVGSPKHQPPLSPGKYS